MENANRNQLKRQSANTHFMGNYLTICLLLQSHGKWFYSMLCQCKTHVHHSTRFIIWSLNLPRNLSASQQVDRKTSLVSLKRTLKYSNRWSLIASWILLNKSGVIACRFALSLPISSSLYEPVGNKMKQLISLACELHSLKFLRRLTTWVGMSHAEAQESF